MLAELVAGREPLEVVVGEDVGVAARLLEPAEEREVVAEEPGRHAALPVWTVEHDGRRAARVPGVAPAVAVRVVEVVGLPCVGRQDDGHTILARLRRPEDERREADPTVVRLELRRIEAARPVARLHDDCASGRALAGPIDRHRVGHREAGHLVAALPRVGAVADAQEREGEGCSIRLHTQCHRLLGQIGALREGRLDAEHSDDRRKGARRRRGPPRAVDPSTAVRLDREPHDVRPDGRVHWGSPRQGMGPRGERRVLRPANVAPVDPHPHGVESDTGAPIEVEEHLRDVASLDSRGDGDEQRPVAGEPLGGAANAQRRHARRRDTPPERLAGEQPDRREAPEGGAQKPPSGDCLEHVSMVVPRAAGARSTRKEGLPPGGPPSAPHAPATGTCPWPEPRRRRPPRRWRSR